MSTWRRSIQLLFATLCMLAFSNGCSSSSAGVNMGGEEGTKVAAVVEELNEVKNNPKKSEAFFVSKQDAATAKKLNQFSYYVAGKPVVEGTTATCKVLIEKLNGTAAGDKDWTFEKVADQWKIKSVALP